MGKSPKERTVMKKSFLVIAIAVALMCLFAITAFAAVDKTEKVDVTLKDGTTQKVALYDTDGDELVWYSLDGGQTLISIKAKDLVYSSTTDLADISLSDGTALQKISDDTTNLIVVANLRGLTFGKVGRNSSYKATFKSSPILQYVYLPNTITDLQANVFMECTKMIVCDIPSDASFKISDSNTFNGSSALVEINLEGCYKLVGHSTFYACSSLTKIIIKPTADVASLSDNFANGCPLTQFGMVPNECNVPYNTTYMGNGCFQKARFTVANLPNGITRFGWNVFASNTNLESVNIPSSLSTSDIRIFKDCTALETVTGLENCALTTIPQEMFLNCPMTGATVKLPTTCTTVGAQAFQGTDIETIYLGPNVTTIGNNSLRDMGSLKNVYITSKVTSIPSETFRSTYNVCFYYTGDSATSLINITVNSSGYNNTILACPAANQIHFDNWDPTTRQDKQSYIIYGVNTCYAFYGNKHTVTGANCTVADTCKNCQLPIEAQAEHIFSETLTYVSFVQNGVYTRSCTFYGCTVANIKAGDEGSDASPLFGGGDGFSTKGEDGIAGGYSINVEAVAAYKRINGELTIGIMVVNPNYFAGKDSFLDSNGLVNTDGGKLQVNLAGNQYQNVNVAISGFNKASGLSLIIALYAYDDVENVEFVQSTTTKCGDKNVTVGNTTLYTVTLASVTAGDSDLSKLGDYTIPTTNDEE